MKDPKVQVELFHLLFLEHLAQKLDKRLYALKGGCNLRFFFGSIRYSEDIDLDVHTVAVTTLEKIVTKILQSLSFQQVLNTYNIVIENFSAPKQTATTQRWKIQLRIPNHSLNINTKIEFSRRDAADSAVLEGITPQLLGNYKLRPIFVSHYPAGIALEQKIWALINRSETQARDVFDIYLLLAYCQAYNEARFSPDQIDVAVANVECITFAQYKAQVLSYLEPSQQKLYMDSAIWLDMCGKVINFLRVNKHETHRSL